MESRRKPLANVLVVWAVALAFAAAELVDALPIAVELVVVAVAGLATLPAVEAAAAGVVAGGGVALVTVPVLVVVDLVWLPATPVEAAVRSTLPNSELFRASAMSVLVGLAVGASAVTEVPLLAEVVVAAVPVLFSSAAAESLRFVAARLLID